MVSVELVDGGFSKVSPTLYRGSRLLTLERLKSDALLNRFRRIGDGDLVLAVVEIGVKLVADSISRCDAMGGVVHSVHRLVGF